MCNVISHRSPENFLTPTILLNRRGHLHFQMHDETGAGEAFMTPKAVPLRKWVQFTFMADGNKTQLTIDFPGTGIHSYSIHHTFKGIILNDENGIWSVGGYPGLEGFHGILSHLTLYRIQALMPKQISNRRKRHESKVMKAFVRQQQKCLAAKELFHQMLHASANRRWMALKRVCPNMRSHPNIRKITRKLPSNQVNILERVFHAKEFAGLNTISSVAEAIYERGVSSYDKNMTDKLELSGCFGHTTSLYVSSILHLYGILTPVSVVKGVAQQLLAAAYGNTLAQMSLAYKHKFGQAGLQKSPCISAGYYRAAAVAAKKIFEREEHSVNTQSEMIRIDSHDVFRRDRGSSSNLVNWLKRQAGYGSATAQKQLAEILFHGQHGVDANKHEALNLYRDGAAQGDASSMYNLGVLHLKGIEVAKNETLAMLLFEAAAEKNFSMAYGSLGYYELVSRNNLTGAIHYWKKATEFGDRDGMFNLGAQYETGVSGVLEKDKVYALELFQRSAEMGQYAACVKVADSLMIGDVISLTNADAIRYYRFVAENHPGIGSFLRKAFDSYLSSNMKEALLNYLMAAETGLALAFYNAALICQQLDSSDETFNLPNYPNCSLLLHGKAAELDWAPSLIQMGDRYWYGDGVPSSKEKAASNYAEAFNLAESPRALFNLAYIIENSFPVKPLKLKEIQNVPIISGNLSLARRLYSRCQHSPTDDNEGYYPCTLALLKLNIKNIYQEFSNYFKTIIGIGRYLS